MGRKLIQLKGIPERDKKKTAGKNYGELKGRKASGE